MDCKNIDQLLETLAKKLNCTYVSDLHAPAMRNYLYAAVESLYGQYPPEAWSKALSYVLGEEVDFKGLKDLKDYFQKNTAPASPR